MDLKNDLFYNVTKEKKKRKEKILLFVFEASTTIGVLKYQQPLKRKPAYRQHKHTTVNKAQINDTRFWRTPPKKLYWCHFHGTILCYVLEKNININEIVI